MSETEANLLEEALNSVKEVKVGDVVKGEVLMNLTKLSLVSKTLV